MGDDLCGVVWVEVGFSRGWGPDSGPKPQKNPREGSTQTRKASAVPLCRGVAGGLDSTEFLQCFWLQGGEDEPGSPGGSLGPSGVGTVGFPSPPHPEGPSLAGSALSSFPSAFAGSLHGQWVPSEVTLEEVLKNRGGPWKEEGARG